MNFFKKHPIISNLLLAVVVSLLIVWGVLAWLDHYTRHDKSIEIPGNIVGQPVDNAVKMLAEKKLRCEVNDSIYVKHAKPGTVFKISPVEGSSVKEGRIITITTYASNPPLITIPDVIDMSQRQAMALLETVGFEDIQIKTVDGQYRNLVVGLEHKGVEVHVGERYHNNISLTVLVSSGGQSQVEEDSLSWEEDEPVIIDEDPEESWF